MVRGEKKVNFADYPSGKLYLTSISPKVIFAGTKKFFRKQKKKKELFFSRRRHIVEFFSKSTATREWLTCILDI